MWQRSVRTILKTTQVTLLCYLGWEKRFINSFANVVRLYVQNDDNNKIIIIVIIMAFKDIAPKRTTWKLKSISQASKEKYIKIQKIQE